MPDYPSLLLSGVGDRVELVARQVIPPDCLDGWPPVEMDDAYERPAPWPGYQRIAKRETGGEIVGGSLGLYQWKRKQEKNDA